MALSAIDILYHALILVGVGLAGWTYTILFMAMLARLAPKKCAIPVDKREDIPDTIIVDAHGYFSSDKQSHRNRLN